MEDYFRRLRLSLDGIPAENIINYDETNLSDNPGSVKCIFRRGTKYPERLNKKCHIYNVCCNSIRRITPFICGL